MSQHRESARRATAALVDLTAKAKGIQAAILRDAPEAEIETLRQEAVSVAEVYIDHTIAAAKATKAIISE